MPAERLQDVLFLLLAAAISGPDTALPRLDAAIRSFNTTHAVIEREVGISQANDLAYRLFLDESAAANAPPTPNSADWQDGLQHQIALDTQAMADLAARSPRAMTAQRRGLYETFVRSSVDGLLLPAAVYVPANARRGGPLALLLHGSGESETNLLAQPFLRHLADETGTVLVAPYARGIANYRGVAPKDIYDVFASARAAFLPDLRHVFLVGYSMGGFGVFHIGPMYKWSAIMDISGALQGSQGLIPFTWRNTPLYVITGKHDIVVPPSLPESTAVELAQDGVPTGLYEQSDGDHDLRSLVPAITAAWLDMHRGIVRSSGSSYTFRQQ